MWRLTSESTEDLDDIARWGLKYFGLRQSRAYDERLLDLFDILAANPQMAAERQGLRRRIRLMPVGSHHVIYVTQEDDVVILRVLHHLQDWFELV